MKSGLIMLFVKQKSLKRNIAENVCEDICVLRMLFLKKVFEGKMIFEERLLFKNNYYYLSN